MFTGVSSDDTMKNTLASVGLVILLAVTNGCSTIAKKAYKEARGARSKLQVVPGTVRGDVGRFKGVRVAPTRTDIGALASAEFVETLPGALRSSLAEGEGAPLPGGSPVIEVVPQVQWYHHAGGLKGIIGSDSYAVVLFLLCSEGDDVGKVQIVTKNAASRIGDREMADSMAKELAAWFSRGGAEEEDD